MNAKNSTWTKLEGLSRDRDLWALASGNPLLLLDKSVVGSQAGDRLEPDLEAKIIECVLANFPDVSAIIELRRELRDVLSAQHQSMMAIDDAIFVMLRNLP